MLRNMAKYINIVVQKKINITAEDIGMQGHYRLQAGGVLHTKKRKR